MYIGAKYSGLTRYLKDSNTERISLSVEEIGKLVPLPAWVRNPKRKPWGNTSQSFAAGWRNAGYFVSHVQGDIVTFIREEN